MSLSLRLLLLGLAVTVTACAPEASDDVDDADSAQSQAGPARAGGWLGVMSIERGDTLRGDLDYGTRRGAYHAGIACKSAFAVHGSRDYCDILFFTDDVRVSPKRVVFRGAAAESIARTLRTSPSTTPSPGYELRCSTKESCTLTLTRPPWFQFAPASREVEDGTLSASQLDALRSEVVVD